jgi:alpha-glucosidase
MQDPNSLLSFYKALIRLRRKEETLRRGSLRILFREQTHILSYLRIGEKDKILILLNFSDGERRVFFGKENLNTELAKVLLSTHRKESETLNLGILSLEPYQVDIIKLIET